MQPLLFDPAPRYTVSTLTRQIRLLFDANPEFQGIWVEGEISNFSRPSSGHLYFTLKDATAQLRCVMWRNDAARLRFHPADGMQVEAHGSLSVYEAGGQYQLYVDVLQPLGEGALYAEFLRRKALLEAEGLFDAARKRPLPPLPQRIGIVTSPTGAALQDMLNVLRRRYPLAEVILSPTPVQGEEAPVEIIRALERLNRLAHPDVILLARGGGSLEDLWAFNDENLARAVAASPAPVITGVGHETDYTLVDFVADLRAPTPTAAAELATPYTIYDLRAGLGQMSQALLQAWATGLQQRRNALEWLQARLRLLSPQRRLQNERQRLDGLATRLLSAYRHRLNLEAAHLQGLSSRLQTLDPLAILQRGYAIVWREADGRLVRTVADAPQGELLRVRVQDGEFYVRATGEQRRNTD